MDPHRVTWSPTGPIPTPNPGLQSQGSASATPPRTFPRPPTCRSGPTSSGYLPGLGAHRGTERFFLYFLLKQGPIAGDIATAWLLYRFVLRETGDLRAAVGALAFWSFFPYDIVIGSIWGQLDPVTNALLLAVFLLAEARAATRSIAWGLGVFIKWITAIFLPFELFRQRGWRRLWPLVALPLAAALTVLAFVVAGWGFGGVVATSTSEAGGGGGGMNYARLFGLAVISNPLRPIPFLYTALNDLWIPACVLAGWVAARWV